MNILKRFQVWRVVSGQYIVVLWSMWWTVRKEIWVEGLCLVNTLLSCEVCDEQFEKKSDLLCCVWSLHCCLVKYVMNILKRNLGWRVVFGQYIVVLWSMWWTVWKEIWFNESYAVSPLVLWMLQWRVGRETLYKDSCLWMQCSCGVWIKMSYRKCDL